VLISHRFSSVRMADRILVLADGKVEASGTHEQLMAQGGRYSELFECKPPLFGDELLFREGGNPAR
jgi:ABC-type multidrug transport system fused ATPase/permease subunit